MESTYTRRHGLRAWEKSDAPHGVGEKRIIKGEKVPTLFRSARMRRTFETDFVSARCALNGVLLSQRLLACLLVKREEEDKKAHAPGFEFVVGTALSSTDCEGSSSLSCSVSHFASSFQRYCNYQQNVLLWVVCVRHGSMRTTITLRSRRQSSRFFFCWKAIDMMHLFTCFTHILDTNSVFTAEWYWKKQKWASAARAVADARIWSFQSHQWTGLVTPNRRSIHK